MHDEALTRITGGEDRRPIHAVATRDLPRLEGGLRIPTLAEALDVCAGRVVNVELKADLGLRFGKRALRVTAPLPRRLALVRAATRVVARARNVEVVFSSFDPMVVGALAGIASKMPRAMLVGKGTPRLAVALPLALRRTIVAAHLEDSIIRKDRVDRLKKSGLRVVAWTVNDATRAATLTEMGVEWLITDRPKTLVEHLR